MWCQQDPPACPETPVHPVPVGCWPRPPCRAPLASPPPPPARTLLPAEEGLTSYLSERSFSLWGIRLGRGSASSVSWGHDRALCSLSSSQGTPPHAQPPAPQAAAAHALTDSHSSRSTLLRRPRREYEEDGVSCGARKRWTLLEPGPPAPTPQAGSVPAGPVAQEELSIPLFCRRTSFQHGRLQSGLWAQPNPSVAPSLQLWLSGPPPPGKRDTGGGGQRPSSERLRALPHFASRLPAQGQLTSSWELQCGQIFAQGHQGHGKEPQGLSSTPGSNPTPAQGSCQFPGRGQPTHRWRPSLGPRSGTQPGAGCPASRSLERP